METDFKFGLWERLAVAAFLAGVAGVVVSVAFPLAYPGSAISIETWRVILWISACVLGGSVLFFLCDLGAHLAVRKGIKLGTALATIGTILIIVGAIVGLIGAFKTDQGPTASVTTTNAPDVTMRLVYPDYPALILVNNSDKLAREIKWSVAIWNLDDPRTYANQNPTQNSHDPLPFPVSTFDYIRPHSEGGPQLLFGSQYIRPYVKEGQHIFGSISVVRPDCVRGHTYVVYWVVGHGGWYTKVGGLEDQKFTEGELLIPHHFTKELGPVFS